MHEPVEWKLFDYSLHGRHIVAVDGDPTPAAVAADGVNFHDFFVQQAVYKIPMARNEGNKSLVKRIGQVKGNNERRHTKKSANQLVKRLLLPES
jgi:hypothetical protein